MESDGDIPFLGRLVLIPVVGHSMRAITTESLVKKGLESAFAPGFKEKIPDQFADDYLRLTYKSLDQSKSSHDEYIVDESLPSRLRKTGKPLQVIFGHEDQMVEPSTLRKYRSGVPGSETHYIENAGHTPMYEKPKQVNQLLLDFSSGRSVK